MPEEILQDSGGHSKGNSAAALEFLRSAGLKGVFGDMVIQTFLAFLTKELILIEKT